MMLTPRASILYQVHSIRGFIKSGSPHLALFELDRLEQALIAMFDRELGIYRNQ